MGLQNQLMDMSSESFPILIVSLIANCLCFLRSSFFTIFQTFGFSFFNEPDPYHQIDTAFCDAVGSGLAGVIMLAEQLNLNRVFSYEFKGKAVGCGGCDDGGDGGFKCVFCLNSLCDGERVRRLACRHVFHKDCFDGWLDQNRFSCPLCRLPLVEDERVEFTRRQVTGDVLPWFSLR
ncbi:hypothetical protein M9H77_08308 [Catharanthus roseus]|uniref:Uncharacterized protein n=1 Tax=Catharanthus roseus TaxID=4058 RepID=A0ACC0BXN2_CATRO|nr:hypothetical protein M9H77_08308 [Catharanthus roseus]